MDGFKVIIGFSLACFALALAQNCSSTIPVNTNTLQCKFSFTAAQTSCASSTFNDCSVRYCIGTTSSSSGATCASYGSFTEVIFTNCMNYCCGGSVGSVDSYTAVMTCSNRPSSNQTSRGLDISKILMIVMISLGAIGLVFAAAFCVYRRFCCFTQTQVVNDIHNPQAVKSSNPKEIAMNEVSIHNLIANREWRDIEMDVMELPSCLICLCENPNLKLSCGHLFHPNCLRMWLQKKHQCGVCRGKKLSNFQLICRHCFKKETRIQLFDFMKLKSNYNKMLCSKCKPQ